MWTFYSQQKCTSGPEEANSEKDHRIFSYMENSVYEDHHMSIVYYASDLEEETQFKRQTIVYRWSKS